MRVRLRYNIWKVRLTFTQAWWHSDGQQINRWWVLSLHSWRYKNTCTKDVTPLSLEASGVIGIFSWCSRNTSFHSITVTTKSILKHYYRSYIILSVENLQSFLSYTRFAKSSYTDRCVPVFLSALPPVMTLIKWTDE